MLEMGGVRHHYGTQAVLDIGSFVLEDGAAVAIVGPNGAGKSTLLRIAAGIERPSEGSVRFAGATAGASVRRHVTLVEQRPLLLRGTVMANLEFGLRMRRVPPRARRARARAAAERLAVAHLIERPAGQLSDGEAQRVAVARAVALAPKVLLLDEPLSAADREAARLLYSVLDEERERGAAVCLASHLLEDVYRWTTDVRALAGGRLTSVTADNLFRVELSGRGETKQAEIGRMHVVVLTDRVGPAVLAIPPEDIVLSRAPLESSARNTVSGRVRTITERGADRGGVAITVDCGIDVTATVTHSAVRELALAPGDSVVLSFKATAVRIF